MIWRAIMMGTSVMKFKFYFSVCWFYYSLFHKKPHSCPHFLEYTQMIRKHFFGTIPWERREHSMGDCYSLDATFSFLPIVSKICLKQN